MLKSVSNWIRGKNPAPSGEGQVPQSARHWYFNKRPKDVIEADTLVMRAEPMPILADGEVLVRSL